MGIPLDPRAGGHSISEDALEVADIIVSTTADRVSGLIRSATASLISHSILYVGDGMVVEAIDAGVSLRTLRVALSDATLAVAYRRDGLSINQQGQIRDYVGQQLGRGYAYAKAWNAGASCAVRKAQNTVGEDEPDEEMKQKICATAGICTATSNPKPVASDRFFCSQLILSAFDDADVPLTNTDPEITVPDEIVNLYLRSVLIYVGHLEAPPNLPPANPDPCNAPVAFENRGRCEESKAARSRK